MIYQLEFQAMGCQMLAASDSPSLPGVLKGVPDWFEEWEQTFSRFRFDSELSRVNQRAGAKTRVTQVFADVLETAIRMERESGGLVTPVLLDALELAGYDRSFDQLSVQMPGLVSEPLLCPHPHTLEEVEWDPATRTIWLPPELHLDFGGIAKGWSAHQSVTRLEKFGPVLVDAGGDIAVSGNQSNGTGWSVGIADPFNPVENLVLLRLGQCGVATSGQDRRRWQRGGFWNHHIIDPGTGFPADSDVLTATVISSTVTRAEMAAKTILIMGSGAGLEYLENDPDLAGMLVLVNGETIHSRRLENYLWS